jgi:hypothetical protein
VSPRVFSIALRLPLLLLDVRLCTFFLHLIRLSNY